MAEYHQKETLNVPCLQKTKPGKKIPSVLGLQLAHVESTRNKIKKIPFVPGLQYSTDPRRGSTSNLLNRFPYFGHIELHLGLKESIVEERR
jgi:hypothetical protein